MRQKNAEGSTGERISPSPDLLPFQLYFQSREQVLVRRGQIRRIGWVTKTLEVHAGQFLLSCKSPVSRFLPGRAKDLSAPLYLRPNLSYYLSICKAQWGEEKKHSKSPVPDRDLNPGYPQKWNRGATQSITKIDISYTAKYKIYSKILVLSPLPMPPPPADHQAFRSCRQKCHVVGIPTNVISNVAYSGFNNLRPTGYSTSQAWILPTLSIYKHRLILKTNWDHLLVKH
jgi:hypothetical protein